ncbi:Uncharacterised protein [uncultured archaeon]|nr:Uncharacterised protein [uncultured archaeon]
MKKNNLVLIILVGALLISNIFFGYMLFFHKNNPNPNGFQNMQLTDAQKQSVTSFFESTTDTAKITDYCNQNKMECFYYCREVNSGNTYCSQLMQNRPTSQPQQ